MIFTVSAISTLHNNLYHVHNTIISTVYNLHCAASKISAVSTIFTLYHIHLHSPKSPHLHILHNPHHGHCQRMPSQQDPILSFSHTYLPKSARVRGLHASQWLGTPHPQWEILDLPLISTLSKMCTHYSLHTLRSLHICILFRFHTLHISTVFTHATISTLHNLTISTSLQSTYGRW